MNQEHPNVFQNWPWKESHICGISETNWQEKMNESKKESKHTSGTMLGSERKASVVKKRAAKPGKKKGQTNPKKKVNR